MTSNEILYTEKKIDERIKELAREIARFFNTDKIVMLILLNGGMPFAIKMGIALLEEGVEAFHATVRVSSGGGGEKATAEPHFVTQLPIEELEGQNVLIVDDIIDSRKTIKFVYEILQQHGVLSIATAALLSKPVENKVKNPGLEFIGFEMDEDHWVYGFGLDNGDGTGRNYPDVRRQLPAVEDTSVVLETT